MSADNRAMRTTFCLVLLLAVALAGCGGGNKAGSGGGKPRVLVFEVPDDGDPPAKVFAAAVASGTHGQLELRHDLAAPYSSVTPANELRLAHALESGKVPVGYLPARAWAAAGIPEFQTLLTPFVLSTDEAARRFAQGPLAAQVLNALPHSVVGLALVPQEPRLFLTTTPPTSRSAFAGLRIRVVDNPQTAAAVRALGADPVQGLDAHQVTAVLLQHGIDGVESSTFSILGNGYQTAVHYFSTYSPFAKFQSIVVSRAVWDDLSEQARTALRSAARAAVAAAVRSLPGDERDELTSLCQAEGVPSRPSATQLAGIATAMRSTARRFVTATAQKELLAQLLRLPGAGIKAVATPLPAACSHPTSRRESANAGTAGATLPAGVYRVTDTYDDWLNGNVINRDFRTAITYVTTIRKNGTWYQTQTPNYPDQGPFSGTWKVHGDEVVFVMLHSGADGHGSITAPETVKWSYFDGRLFFRIVIVADAGSRVLYEAHPWRKIR